MLSSVSTELKANPQIPRLPQLLHSCGTVQSGEEPVTCEDLATASQHSMFCVEKMPDVTKRAAFKPEGP